MASLTAAVSSSAYVGRIRTGPFLEPHASIRVFDPKEFSPHIHQKKFSTAIDAPRSCKVVFVVAASRSGLLPSQHRKSRRLQKRKNPTSHCLPHTRKTNTN